MRFPTVICYLPPCLGVLARFRNLATIVRLLIPALIVLDIVLIAATFARNVLPLLPLLRNHPYRPVHALNVGLYLCPDNEVVALGVVTCYLLLLPKQQ